MKYYVATREYISLEGVVFKKMLFAEKYKITTPNLFYNVGSCVFLSRDSVVEIEVLNG